MDKNTVQTDTDMAVFAFLVRSITSPSVAHTFEGIRHSPHVSTKVIGTRCMHNRGDVKFTDCLSVEGGIDKPIQNWRGWGVLEYRGASVVDV